jgi:hypothetical protein
MPYLGSKQFCLTIFYITNYDVSMNSQINATATLECIHTYLLLQLTIDTP